MWKGKGNDNLGSIGKDEAVMINNFEAANKLLNHGEVSLNRKYPSFRQKMDLFFIDYDFIPLLVQESYLNSFSERQSMRDVENMAMAADMISFGDQINVQIRQDQNWNLLPQYGIFSSVAPCLIARGKSYFPPFPQWLGKNSS